MRQIFFVIVHFLLDADHVPAFTFVVLIAIVFHQQLNQGINTFERPHSHVIEGLSGTFQRQCGRGNQIGADKPKCSSFSLCREGLFPDDASCQPGNQTNEGQHRQRVYEIEYCVESGHMVGYSARVGRNAYAEGDTGDYPLDKIQDPAEVKHHCYDANDIKNHVSTRGLLGGSRSADSGKVGRDRGADVLAQQKCSSGREVDQSLLGDCHRQGHRGA